jgi:NitT/TauT family transport system ATP-binding protein
VPTPYPKCSPTEMVGLLVLLNTHKGNEEIARLADDLDLEIDEILPAVDFAELLGFLRVTDGRAILTDAGAELLAGTIRDRKHLIREKLGLTTLYKAILRALEGAPDRQLTDEQLNQLISFTTAPADAFVQNIINWGRYAEMFRYDSDQHLLLPTRARTSRATSAKRPPAGGLSESASPTASSPASGSVRSPTDHMAPVSPGLA